MTLAERVIPRMQRAPRPHRWTRAQYHQMADAGLFKNTRVELIEGDIIDLAPKNNPHAVSVGLIQRALARAFPDSDYWVRIQSPLAIGEISEPEPDLLVVGGSPRDYAEHPSSGLLIIDVAETTLRYDRGTKGSLYAAAGIEDYWVVNLINRQLEVYRNPIGKARRARYADPMILSPAKSVSPLAAPKTKIRVADLLP